MAKTYTPSTVHPSAEKELRDALTAKLLHNFSVQPESATNEHFTTPWSWSCGTGCAANGGDHPGGP